MIDHIKIGNLIEKLKQVFDEEVMKEDITLEETLHVLQGLIAPVCLEIAQNSNSQEELDNQESWASMMLRDAMHPFFENRRKQLIAEGSYTFANYSKEVISDQMTSILAQNNVTLDDGLFLVGELAGMVTMLQAENVPTLNDLETTERNILGFIKEKVSHAGDLIRLKRGFIQKN